MQLRTSPGEKNPTRRIAGDVVEIYRQMIFRQSRSSALGPLHQNQGARNQDVVPAQIRELVGRLDPIEIDVKHRRPLGRVFLDQRVGRTGDRIVDTVAETDRLREGRFAYPQLAGKCYEQRRIDGPAEVLTPLAKLTFGELEVPSLGEWGDEVPVRWHC